MIQLTQLIILMTRMLPEVTTNFILSLYEKRNIKVVTSFSLTSEFEAEDSIDQGEVISLLV